MAGLALVPGLLNALATDSNDKDSPPRLEIGALDHDFGAIHAGDALDASFLVRNRGGRRLILHEIKGGCGCMKTNRSVIIVPPGDTATLRSRIETEHLAGPLKLEVRYRTNDPTQTELKLFVLVDVQHPVKDATTH